MSVPFVPSYQPSFPEYDPRHDCYNGLVCISDSLAPEMLLAAYRKGIFPWFSEDGLFYWFSQNPRAVLLPERLHLSRSLQKTLRNKPYRITANACFAETIAACAAIPRAGQGGTWIAPEFQAAYTALHHMGHAHSFECWLPDEYGMPQLAGGFYGVQIGSVFYGESMFARQPDASKTAFACAVPYLARCGIRLIDCQQNTAHLARFGSQTMPFTQFRALLGELNRLPLVQAVGQGTVVAQNAAEKFQAAFL